MHEFVHPRSGVGIGNAAIGSSRVRQGDGNPTPDTLQTVWGTETGTGSADRIHVSINHGDAPARRTLVAGGRTRQR